MKCPFCGYLESKVNDTRMSEGGEKIRRRRECLSCGERFTTFELVETIPIIVVKRDLSRETFDRSKLLNGLIKSCEKRSIPIETLENMVIDIEKALQNSLRREIPSKEIGELVMDRLKNVDEVAYVRFASVYKSFKDIESFMLEVKNVISEKKDK